MSKYVFLDEITETRIYCGFRENMIQKTNRPCDEVALEWPICHRFLSFCSRIYVLEMPLLEDTLLERLIRSINDRIVLNFFGAHTAVKEDVGEAETKISSYYAQRAEEIMDKYGNNILRMAYSYLHNMSDAEDILQDTLIQYIKTKPELNGDDHEKAWLLKVAANLSKNKIKYNKLRETDELMEELVANEKEDLSFVWEAVKSLPEKYSEVLHLFYQESLSTKQISEILDRKESTVRSDLLRGRDKLKEILKEAYDFE